MIPTLLKLEGKHYRFAPRQGSRKYFAYRTPGVITKQDSDMLRELFRSEADVHDYLIQRAKHYLNICRIVVMGGG